MMKVSLDKQIAYFKELANEGKVEIYNGVDGYSIPLVERIQIGDSPVKQIINGKRVAEFHKKTDYLVNQIISQRVEKGIAIKNLIRQGDKDLKIELSNPETLKETRLLPESFELEGIIAIFGQHVAITSMDEDEPFGIVICDPVISTMFENMFDVIWEISEEFRFI